MSIGIIRVDAEAATSEAVFSFVDSTTLTTSCADLVKGVSVEVQNDSAKSQTLHYSFGPVSDSQGGSRPMATLCGGLSARVRKAVGVTPHGPSATLEPGASATVLITGSTLPSGAPPNVPFVTTLVIFADAGRVTRLSLVVDQGNADMPAIPLVDSMPVTHQRYDPADDWEIWIPVKLAPDQAPSLKKGESVGVLSGEGGTTIVTYEGRTPRRLTSTSSLLPLHVDPIGAGSYSGKLTLASGATTTVVLTAKHWWLLAYLTLLAGILVALLIQRYNGYWRPRARLFDRVQGVTAEKAAAVARIKASAGTHPWKDFDLSGLAELQDALRNEIDEKTKGRAIFQIEQKVLDSLEGDVSKLEGTVDQLEMIASVATDIDGSLARLKDDKSSELPPLRGSDRGNEESALERTARELQSGTSLTTGQLSDRLKQLSSVLQTIDTTDGNQHELALYWKQANELERGLTADEQKAEVATLKSALLGVRHALWSGDSPESLDVRISLDTAHNTITKLWSLLPSPSLPAASEFDRSAVGGGGYLGPEYFTAPEQGITAASDLSAEEASKIIKGAAWRQLVVITGAIAVAIVTGINTLYVGKAWGTPWDYLTAFFWGLMTQALITAIAGAIDGLGPQSALRFGFGAHPKLS